MSIDGSPSLRQHFLDPALPEILVYKSVICLRDNDILHEHLDQLLFVVKPKTIFASLQKIEHFISCGQMWVSCLRDRFFEDICNPVHGALHAMKNTGIQDLGCLGSRDSVAGR